MTDHTIALSCIILGTGLFAYWYIPTGPELALSMILLFIGGALIGLSV